MKRERGGGGAKKDEGWGCLGRDGKTYASTSNNMQFASPYPNETHFASALQSAWHAENVFFVPLDSK
jgi:hypothetical protein